MLLHQKKHVRMRKHVDWHKLKQKKKKLPRSTNKKKRYVRKKKSN